MEYITRLKSLPITLIRLIGVQLRRKNVARKKVVKTSRPKGYQYNGHDLADFPRSVKVGYKDIKIDYVTPDFKHDDMTDSYGQYKAREALIQIQHDLNGQEMANTMFHEVLHAVVYGSGLNQANGPLKEDDAEELTVNQISNYCIGVFRDNPWFLDFLKEQLEKEDENI